MSDNTIVNKQKHIRVMSKVFVSYKRDNKDMVLPLVQKLESEIGISCWVDLTDIESDE